jgi:hypothetical protein
MTLKLTRMDELHLSAITIKFEFTASIISIEVITNAESVMGQQKDFYCHQRSV